MGWRYVTYRIGNELMKKTGLVQKKYPVSPPFISAGSLENWKKQNTHFFFSNRESLTFPRVQDKQLKETFDNICSGKILLFNSLLMDVGQDYDWVTNPENGYCYDKNKHWTEIADFSKEAGDIKYVWEKSRFSYLYDIIRYDYHFNTDCSEIVFKDIISWIDNNPINCGPNYRCSQEMSLRILNWTFALFYYKNSACLTEAIFSKIQNVIYWQIDHVSKNINFSRIAVRNNHAITETLTMYLTGLLYPSLPNSGLLKSQGKKWFEEEIAYQVYEDGTFLQFSMNYHRVVVQLLTWAIVLSEKNNERFSEVVYDRAKKSVLFLRSCMIDESGMLPNYGNNDGALFFKLNSGQFRDYRPQIQALASALGVNPGIHVAFEDSNWYGITKSITENCIPINGVHAFTKSGYYIIREVETLTFIRCGNHKDRPHQADNLHIDVWYKGVNVLADAGSYKYNTDEKTLRYFSGTQSHNTVMLDDCDQMLKGARFIWYYWSQCIDASIEETATAYIFRGTIKAFQYISKDIQHRRTITKHKGQAAWEIKDEILNAPDNSRITQLWHIPQDYNEPFSITASDNKLEQLPLQKQQGWHSSLYGQKENINEYYFSTKDKVINTIIVLES